MAYLGKVELKNSNIRRWTGIPGAVDYISYGSSGINNQPLFVPFNEPSTFITVNGVKQHDGSYTLTDTRIEFSSLLDMNDEVEVSCIFEIGLPVTTSDNTIGISQLKVSDGSPSQVLTTDGSGNLSFQTASGSGGGGEFDGGDSTTAYAVNVDITIDCGGVI